MLYRYVWIYGIDSTGSRPWLLDRACLPVVACYLLPAAAAAAVAAAAGWRLWRFVVQGRWDVRGCVVIARRVI